MKKNRILSIALLSIFTISALTIPVRAKASALSTTEKVVALSVGVVTGFFVVYKALDFFFGGSKDEGEAGGVKIKIVTGDITKQKDVDAIVNAANAKLKRGGGVCGAIFSKAGSKCLKKECEKVLRKHRGKIPVGKSVITSGCNLKQKIIHTVSPNFNPYNKMQKSIKFNSKGKEALEKTYKGIFELAERKGLEKIAVPILSSGNFAPSGVDKQELVDIPLRSAAKFCRSKKRNLEEIRFVLYNKKDFPFFKQNFINRFKRAKKTVLCR